MTNLFTDMYLQVKVDGGSFSSQYIIDQLQLREYNSTYQENRSLFLRMMTHTKK